MSRLAKKGSSYLFTIKQKSDEPLKDFLGRFNKAMLVIPEAETKAAIATVKPGVLMNSTFFNSILKCMLITMEQFMEKAQKYILQEEKISARKDYDIKSMPT